MINKGNQRLLDFFYQQDVLDVAPALLGKYLVRKFPDGKLKKYYIIETEAYKGEQDQACHAFKGRTKRTEIMYHQGGRVYVYLIYGMYWMFNIVTGNENDPQAVLIRSVEDYCGPGKVGKEFQLDKSFYGENLVLSQRIWIKDTPGKVQYKTDKRIGINYAGKIWKDKKWRFIAL